MKVQDFKIGETIKVSGNGTTEKISRNIKACERCQAKRTIGKGPYKLARLKMKLDKTAKVENPIRYKRIEVVIGHMKNGKGCKISIR